MIEFITQNPAIFYIIVLLSSIMSSAIGVGSFILIPFAVVFFGVKQAVGVMTLYFLIQNINKLIFFKKHINYGVAKQIIFWSVPGGVLGAILLNYIPPELFKKMLAAFVVIYLMNDILKITKQKIDEKTLLPVFGVFYGFASGLLGSGNLIKGPLFISMGILKESYIGTYALTSLFVNIPKIAAYQYTGIIDLSSYRAAIPFVVISFAGTYLGKDAIEKIRSEIFNAIVYVFFMLSALLIVIS